MTTSRRGALRSHTGYKHQIAVSYASEDRKIVGRIARGLSRAGARVFFAPEQKGQLWGKDSAEFAQIYGPLSRIVMPFVSKHYVSKDWTRWEFDAARAEEKRRGKPVIYPVRVDDSPLLGLPSDRQYLDAREVSAKKIIAYALGKLGLRKTAPTSTPKSADLLRMATGPTRTAALLLAAAPPATLARHLPQLVPTVAWESELRNLRRIGWTQTTRGFVSLVPRVLASLQRDEADLNLYRQEWVRYLEPLADYPDTALMLGMEYLSQKRISEAITVITNRVEGLYAGGAWNDIYGSVLGGLLKSRARRFDAKSKVLLRNAYGICLSRQGKNEAAIAEFQRLRKISKRTRNAWGLGQSLINEGVARVERGQERRARPLYEEAIRHARRTGDEILLGRSLGNLAQILPEGEWQRAQSLLGESLRTKRKAHDRAGMLGGLIALGNFAAGRGNLSKAISSYRGAAREAERLDAPLERVLALRNLASAHFERGERNLAYKQYAEAEAVADAEDDLDGQVLEIRKAHALAREKAGDHASAARLFRRIARSAVKAGNVALRAVALHNEATNLEHLGRKREASRKHRTARELADLADQRWLAVRCSVGEGRALGASDAKAALRVLQTAARRARNLHARHLEAGAREELAALYEHGKHFGAAERELERLTSLVKSKEDRSVILLTRLRCGIRLRTWKKVENLFARAQETFGKGQDPPAYVDAHMMLGDALWVKSQRARPTGLQAYVAGMIGAIEINYETFLRVGAHIVVTLVRGFRRSEWRTKMVHLSNSLERWLVDQGVKRNSQVTLTWPLRVATAICDLLEHGKEPTAKMLASLMKRELAAK